MLNRVTLMGRMVRDPELRTTGAGVNVANFALAVDRDFTSGGERGTDFIECVAWRNTADFVNSYFAKGQMAAVTGRLQLRDWTDNNGNKRKNAEVVVDAVYFCGDKKSDAEAKPKTPSFEDISDGDEVLPF